MNNNITYMLQNAHFSPLANVMHTSKWAVVWTPPQGSHKGASRCASQGLSLPIQ